MSKKETNFDNPLVLALILMALTVLVSFIFIFLGVPVIIVPFLGLLIASIILNKIYSKVRGKVIDDKKRLGMSFFYAFVAVILAFFYFIDRTGIRDDYAIGLAFAVGIFNFLMVYIFLVIGASFFYKPTKEEIEKQEKEDKKRLKEEEKRLKEFEIEERKIKKLEKISIKKLEKKSAKKLEKRKAVKNTFMNTNYAVIILLVISTILLSVLVTLLSESFKLDEIYQVGNIFLIPFILSLLIPAAASLIIRLIYQKYIKQRNKISIKKVSLIYSIVIILIALIFVISIILRNFISIIVVFSIVFVDCYFSSYFILKNIFNKPKKKKR